MRRKKRKIKIPSPPSSGKYISPCRPPQTPTCPLTHPYASARYRSEENSQSSEFRIKPKVTLGSVDVPTYCVRFDYNDKYIAAAKGDGSIQIYNLFTGKMSYIVNENMQGAMPTTIMR